MRRRQKTKTRAKPSKGKKGRKLFVVVLVLAFFAFVFGPQLKMLWDMKGEIQALQEQKSELLKKKAELTRLERDLQTNEAIERMAREQLGMVKPGEKVMVKVVPEQGSGQ
ncbi:MAG: septum formation initiator family protein [Syntrophothermus sp.]|uniref:FtsB family cell division protein n=1 Tax=Syntrophothermus sp. TaxID=2736299 RepID=UPI0025810470|nr:septum formation initiator family protein [Syntrophothermus sp.]NSW84152.1 septum formation initiator family protein [Syntrophothermus sp.]